MGGPEDLGSRALSRGSGGTNSQPRASSSEGGFAIRFGTEPEPPAGDLQGDHQVVRLQGGGPRQQRRLLGLFDLGAGDSTCAPTGPSIRNYGGRRMAAFALQPHVAEFLDVVMHDETLDYRIEEIKITPASPLVGRCLADTALRSKNEALVLAIRIAGGQFVANPSPDTRLDPDTILIVLGTSAQLRSLRSHFDPV